MQMGRYTEPMLRERCDEIVPADDDGDKRISRSSLARASEGLDAECGCFDLFVSRYALVFSAVEEVLALVRDKGPLCKGTTSVATRSRCLAYWLGTSHGFLVDVPLLQQDLCCDG